MAVAALTIDLEARLGRLEQDLSRATRLIERDAGKMQRAFAASGAALQKTIGLLSSTVAVSFLAQIATRTIDSIDALNDLADATGSTVEKISALEDLGARTGTSIDTIGSAIVKLNQGLADTKEDSNTSKALNRIGLSAAELRNLDPADALKRVADALAGFADDGDKARLVQELFGKSVKEVAPLLKDLAEAGTLNATVTTAQAKEAEKFNQQLSRLSKNISDVARSAVSELVPALNRLFEAARSKDGLLGSFGKQLVEDFNRERLQAITNELTRLAPAAERARGILARQPDSIRAKATLAEFAELQRAAEEYRLEIDKQYQGGSRRPANEGGGGLRGGALPTVGDGGSAVAARAGRVARSVTERSEPFGPELPDSIAAALKRLEDVDTVKLTALREQLQKLVELGANGNSQALEALPGLVEEIAKIDPEAKKAAEGLEKAKQEAERLADILGQTSAGQLAAVTEEVEFLNAQFAAGKIASVEQWADAVRNATGKLGEAVTRTKELDGLSKELGLTFASSFEDAIVNGGKFSDILKGLEQDILRVLTRKLLTEPLANAAGSFLGGLFPSANGNAFGPGGVIPFANGGVVNRRAEFGFGNGRRGSIAENEPEGILPLRRGRDGKLGVISQGGGRVTNISVNVQAVQGMSRETAMQQGASIGRGLQRAMARNT